MKRYLLTMSALLVLALLAGIVVWYLYQDMNPAKLTEISKSPEALQGGEVEMGVPEQAPPAGTEPLIVNKESLSSAQQAMLKAFGVEGTEFTITEGMITCAKREVGAVRFEEILSGGAPTPLEALSLLPCMK